MQDALPFVFFTSGKKSVKDGPIMTTTPFLALCLRRKKDAILARQRARRVASLLNFDLHEQACIAAGTFFIGCQALMLFGKAKLLFQIENQQLHIFAQDGNEDATQSGPKRLAGVFAAVDARSLFRLTKTLPPRDLAAEDLEIGWLVKQVEKTACNAVFDEIIKQNQEILALLHELRIFQLKNPTMEEKSPNPHAA